MGSRRAALTELPFQLCPWGQSALCVSKISKDYITPEPCSISYLLIHTSFFNLPKKASLLLYCHFITCRWCSRQSLLPVAVVHLILQVVLFPPVSLTCVRVSPNVAICPSRSPICPMRLFSSPSKVSSSAA